MEVSSAPSTSGRGVTAAVTKPALVFGLLLASCAIASAQWVVETNSFRIREPATVEGEYDSAIGDVSPPCHFCKTFATANPQEWAQPFIATASAITSLGPTSCRPVCPRTPAHGQREDTWQGCALHIALLEVHAKRS